MKKIRFMIVLCLITVILVSCGDKPATVPGTTDPKKTTNSSSAHGSEQVDEHTEEIEVAYVDDQVTDIIKAMTEIKFLDSQDKYTKVYEAMQRTDDPAYVSLWSAIELNSLKFVDGELTLDVHIPDEARLGSGAEVLALDVLKETMFQFDEVLRLELLVDGAAVDSFMGHTELEHPIVRNIE